MKFLIIISLFVLGLSWNKCNAQSVKLGSKTKGKISSPIKIFLKSTSILEEGRWAFCADVALNKNSLPYASLGGNLLRQYHGSAPIYGCYALSGLFSVEGGAYFGMVANRAQALGENPLPLEVNANLDLGFDSGLVSGLSFDLKNLGRLRLRYNYGLSKLVTVDNQAIKTRRVDLGLNFHF
jgi:hypothetical protein